MMEKIYEINIMENKKIVWGLNITSFILLIPFFPLFTYLADLVTENLRNPAERGFDFLFYLFPLFILLLCIHEAIHGLFFKLFCPENPVKYGFKWKSLMAYATSPGSLYNRQQFMVIALAPFVLISLALTLGLALGWLSDTLYVVLAACHAAGCVGDFYYAYLLLVKFARADIRIEDTETGIFIYQA